MQPKDLTVNAAYQCEQGQKWTLIVAQLALPATLSLAGNTWSLDGLLGLFSGLY